MESNSTLMMIRYGRKLGGPPPLMVSSHKSLHDKAIKRTNFGRFQHTGCVIWNGASQNIRLSLFLFFKINISGTVECFPSFCFVVKTSNDKLILQIFDIFSHDFSLFSTQLTLYKPKNAEERSC